MASGSTAMLMDSSPREEAARTEVPLPAAHRSPAQYLRRRREDRHSLLTA
jgi:hypothetical protein